MPSSRFLAPWFMLAVLLPTIVPFPASAAPKNQPGIFEIRSSDGEIHTFKLPTANLAGGFSLATGDLGTDGKPELVVGNGLGNEPRVRVLRADGSEIGSFLTYDETMGFGVQVAVCDLDGDGANEVITVPNRGYKPLVRVFDHFGKQQLAESSVFDESFTEGINLACGDLTGDGTDELITLPAIGGGPHVRVWNLLPEGLTMKGEFFAGGADDSRGLVGVTNNQTLILTQQHLPTTLVTLSFTPDLHPSLVANETIGEISEDVTGLFIHNQNVLASTSGKSSLVDLRAMDEESIESTFGSIVATSADLDGDTKPELIIAPGRVLTGEDEGPRSIVVDISEQRLYAFEHGRLANTFLISSGKGKYQTPRGKTSVLAKIYLVNYKWSYGVDNPNNYDLGYVPYNLRIFPHIYIHYAYWHNNFGYPMSHGCVNVNKANMKWVYDWADEGVPVTVRD